VLKLHQFLWRRPYPKTSGNVNAQKFTRVYTIDTAPHCIQRDAVFRRCVSECMHAFAPADRGISRKTTTYASLRGLERKMQTCMATPVRWGGEELYVYITHQYEAMERAERGIVETSCVRIWHLQYHDVERQSGASAVASQENLGAHQRAGVSKVRLRQIGICPIDCLRQKCVLDRDRRQETLRGQNAVAHWTRGQQYARSIYSKSHKRCGGITGL
jgi:hypothetical protein